MKEAEKYVMRFGGLKLGQYDFDYQLDATFFDLFDYSGIDSGKVDVQLTLDKKEIMMVLHLQMDGEVIVPCDRCLEEVSIPIVGDNQLIVKFGSESLENTDEILVLEESDYEMDLSHYLYENVALLVPQRTVHEEGQCNREVLNRLKELQKDEEPTTDPRWAELGNLNIKKDN